MIKNSKKVKSQEATLYNNILLLSRNKLFYTKFDLIDTFQNRIHLIFIHISFLFGIMFSLGNALLFEINALAISLVVTIVGGSGLVILRRRMALGAS